jgi:hypothetical protein
MIPDGNKNPARRASPIAEKIKIENCVLFVRDIVINLVLWFCEDILSLLKFFFVKLIANGRNVIVNEKASNASRFIIL